MVGSYCAFERRHAQSGTWALQVAPPSLEIVSGIRARAVHAAIPRPVARREEVDVGRLRIGRDRGLPVVQGRAHHLRPDPAGRGSRSRRDLLPEVALGPRLGERLEAPLRDLGLFLRLGGTATALFDLALELSLGLGALAGCRRSPQARPLGFRRRSDSGGGSPPGRWPGRCQALRSRNGAESSKSP